MHEVHVRAIYKKSSIFSASSPMDDAIEMLVIVVSSSALNLVG